MSLEKYFGNFHAVELHITLDKSKISPQYRILYTMNTNQGRKLKKWSNGFEKIRAVDYDYLSQPLQQILVKLANSRIHDHRKTGLPNMAPYKEIRVNKFDYKIVLDKKDQLVPVQIRRNFLSNLWMKMWNSKDDPVLNCLIQPYDNAGQLLPAILPVYVTAETNLHPKEYSAAIFKIIGAKLYFS